MYIIGSVNLKWEVLDRVSKFNVFYYHDSNQYDSVEILKVEPKFNDEQGS